MKTRPNIAPDDTARATVPNAGSREASACAVNVRADGCASSPGKSSAAVSWRPSRRSTSAFSLARCTTRVPFRGVDRLRRPLTSDPWRGGRRGACSYPMPAHQRPAGASLGVGRPTWPVRPRRLRRTLSVHGRVDRHDAPSASLRAAWNGRATRSRTLVSPIEAGVSAWSELRNREMTQK
jgi:hypothetical protein